MAVDKVKPLKMETPSGGTETDSVPTATDPSEDYLATKGIAFENDDDTRIEKVGTEVSFFDIVTGAISLSKIRTALFNLFDNSTNGFIATEVQSAIEEAKATGDAAIFPITLQHNGVVNNNTFFGYSSLIPGDDTPVIIQKDALFTGFTFSNKVIDADFTLEFRKNSLVSAPFLTVSKTNTQFFSHDLVSQESFSQEDEIYVKYIDDGTNASDVGIVLTMKAV